MLFITESEYIVYINKTVPVILCVSAHIWSISNGLSVAFANVCALARPHVSGMLSDIHFLEGRLLT